MFCIFSDAAALCGSLLFVYISLAIWLLWRESSRRQHSKPALSGRTLLVTAHPDDETMFFGPCAIGLKSSDQEAASLSILCLSAGDFYGQGDVRKRELLAAARKLGCRQVHIVEDEALQDGQQNVWDTAHLAALIGETLQREAIENLITFDGVGVSGHANHVALSRCLPLLRRTFSAQVLNMYQLETVNITRKYLGFLELPITLLLDYCCSKKKRQQEEDGGSITAGDALLRRGLREAASSSSASRKLTFVLNFRERRLLLTALRKHHSQMLWFRHLYATFSRYMFVNTLNKVYFQD